MALRRALLTLVTLVTLLITISLAAPLGAAEPPPLAAAGPGEVYLALGDSLATGDEEPSNTAGEGDLPGYPAYLLATLRQTLPISYTNLGVSGETSSSMLAQGGQLDAAVAFIGAERAAGRRVSPVTLSIGGNDMVNVLLPVSTTTVTDALTLYRANLEQILDRLVLALDEGGAPSGDLLIMNYYNPYPNLSAYVPSGTLKADPDRDVPRFNQIIAEEAAERGISVVDAYSAFLGREASLTFVIQPYQLFPVPNPALDYHPREAGHRVLAARFADATGYVLRRLWVPVVQ